MLLSADNMLHKLRGKQLIRLWRNNPIKEDFNLISLGVREQRDTPTGIEFDIELKIKGKLIDWLIHQPQLSDLTINDKTEFRYEIRA